jgi:LytS/YehU family sensor histidine kinase
MRHYLEASMIGSGKDESVFNNEIALHKEIELLQMYAEFEQLQYRDKFVFDISIDPMLISSNYRIPPMILQPFVENAIKHGLFYQERLGHLWIRFVKKNEEVLQCIIEDDGVGRERAAEIQKNSIKSYQSRGTELVNRRVVILNEIGYDIDIQTNDRAGGGTVVTVLIGYK